MRQAETAAYQGDDPQGTTWSFGTSWSFGTTWAMAGIPGRMIALVATVVVAASMMAAPQNQQAAQAAAGQAVENVEGVVQVLVRAVAGSDEAERAVERLGGTVVQRIGLVDGIVVEIEAGQVGALARSAGVLSVTENTPVRVFDRRGAAGAMSGESPLVHVRKVTGSSVSERRGYDGSGVGVAIVDTGTASVDGLPKLYRGPNVGGGTSEDGYGHGTHLAGIVGGNDQGATAENFIGVASEANIVSVKAAADDGSTNLFVVLSALDWVLEHKDAQNIRVLNLSLGVEPLADYRYDLLAVAVERLWFGGIVVVVAAGNDGEEPGSPITSPAYDPYVIAVGSADTKATDTHGDDIVQPFSPRGTAARRVDVVAPGQSLVSLRAPGSLAETNFPEAHVGTRFIKGTGTSQAAAVVSGLAADLLEQRPSLTPDQVKALLKSSATPLSGTDAEGQGNGLVNLKRALATGTPTDAVQTWEPAGVTPSSAPDVAYAPPPPPDSDYCGYDITLGPPAPPSEDGTSGTCGWTGGTWTDGTFTGGTWTGGTWTGGTWTGGTWTGGTWTGGTWTGGTWTGGTWTGGTWTDGDWTGGTWTGGTWTGGTWTGGTWTGGTWTGGTWTGGTWTGGTWTGGTWTGGTWTGGTWTGGTWTGGTWTGGTWTGGTWTGGTWTGGTWTGGTWTGGTWTGGTWTGGTWTGGTWTGGTWTGGTWTGGTWTGGTWTGGTWTGGTWTGGTWTGAAWTGTTWS